MITKQHGLQSSSCQQAGSPLGQVQRKVAVISLWRRTPRQTPRMRKAFSSSHNAQATCATDTIVEGSTLHARPEASELLTLYTHTLCPYAQRSYTTLLCKVLTWGMSAAYGCPADRQSTKQHRAAVLQQVQHRTVHIDLSNKPSWYSQVNHKGLVPAVEYEGQVHTESIDICRYSTISYTSKMSS